ncbi:MAG: NACHT domain-containing protein [Dyella sp.]|uniref:NACHT domain-containing protein n=1 Tax=Dyella sp. TaxID=1869338 RepID=UPI003F7EBC6A
MESLLNVWNIKLTWVGLVGGVILLAWSVVRSLMVSRLNRRLDKLIAFKPFALEKYRVALSGRLMDMPFLYKDMHLSAKDDYVEMLLSTADASAKPLGSPRIDYRTPLLRFRQSRRALLFGDGGFGKTTLFRHVILRSLEGKKAIRPFARNVVPIFVALKAVRLSSEFPILDCIQASASYFSGDLGYRRLCKLARQGRLAIFLDGYDEMPYSGGADHAVKELKTFFGRCDKRQPNFFEAQKEFYVFSQGCRVYLSSRREFFFYNQFEVSGDVVRWLARGLGDRRAELVGRIFSRYRSSSEYFNDILDEELFLQQLAESCDSQLIELSYSPLFLTVICYIYIENFKGSGRSPANGVFANGARGLIDKCIDLLISDVDEYKARGLNDVQRMALLNRRSAYPAEKREFLQFFAANLYESDLGIFDREEIIRLADTYFANRVGTPDSIVRGLDSDDPTVNLVDQLIFCGIFVVVDVRKGERIFDFPHRSFREALAIGYYSLPENVARIISNFNRPSFGELALAFVERSFVGDRILKAVLSNASSGLYDARQGEFLVDALQRVEVRVAEDVSTQLIDTLSNFSDARIPGKLVRFLPSNDLYRGHVWDLLLSSIDNLDYRRLNYWIAVGALKELESVLDRFLNAVGLLDLEGARAAMYVPAALSRDVRRRLILHSLGLCETRSNFELVLFDIYRCFFVGKNPQDRDLVHESLVLCSQKLCHAFMCGREMLIDNLDYAFAGVLPPEGRRVTVKAFEIPRPAFVCQFYAI